MKKEILSSTALLILASAIWWMSANVLWLGDDLDYKYMMKGGIWQSWGFINSFTDFCKSQWIHYLHVNGRCIAHILVQLFNGVLGQQCFAICNGIIYMLFAFLMGEAGKVNTLHNFGGILSAICLSVLCFITKMMPTCQIGYIWAMTANIGWMMLFFKKRRPSRTVTIAIMLTGVIVGNWQESVSIGVCGGLGIWWLAMAWGSRKPTEMSFDWCRSWMLLGYVTGTAINCLAPSTIGRVSDITMPLTDRMLIASYSFPAVIVLIVCVIYVRNRHVNPRLFTLKTRDGTIPEGVLTIAMLFLITFNILIGIYSNRQLFGANLFASILALRILPRHRFGIIFNTIASLIILAFWTIMLQGMREISRQYGDILKLHSQSKDGSVYYDRTRVMTMGFPLRAKYYEDILGLFDNDLHHSMMKDLKHTRKGRGLKLKPTNMIDGEKVERYAPGHFIVTLKEPPKGEPPREIIVYGHYIFPGLTAAPRRMKITKYSKRKTPYATAVIIPEYPFFTTDSISIIEK